jgi:diguanylate cyclase (GGDEF)-like protein
MKARLRAGQRVVSLYQEVDRDRSDIQRVSSELAVSNRRLQEMAQTDPLTELPNRRYAMDRIAQEWEHATRSNRPLACLVVDLDDLKGINDNNGHEIGDAALRLAAAGMKDALRVCDVVCRVGGDEFLVICPDTTLEAAIVCAERVIAAVAAVQVPAASGAVSLTVSVGVAMRTADMGNPDALMKVADVGAYLAKRAGRNCYMAPQIKK